MYSVYIYIYTHTHTFDSVCIVTSVVVTHWKKYMYCMYSISNIRKFMSSWPLLDTDCSFINPWLAVIFIGVRPHNSPNHLRFLPGGLCSWLQEPDIFFFGHGHSHRRWNWAASSFFGSWCRKPKVEWPYQDPSEKKGVPSIQWWMDGAVGSNVFSNFSRYKLSNRPTW